MAGGNWWCMLSACQCTSSWKADLITCACISALEGSSLLICLSFMLWSGYSCHLTLIDIQSYKLLWAETKIDWKLCLCTFELVHLILVNSLNLLITKKVLQFSSFRTCLSTIEQFGKIGTTLIQKAWALFQNLWAEFLQHINSRFEGSSKCLIRFLFSIASIPRRQSHNVPVSLEFTE